MLKSAEMCVLKINSNVPKDTGFSKLIYTPDHKSVLMCLGITVCDVSLLQRLFCPSHIKVTYVIYLW